mgnify:CR=1 FL=1
MNGCMDVPTVGAMTEPRTLRSRRSCLAVPGSSPKMLGKAKGLPADQLFMDIEDAVAPLAKPEARKNIVAALNEGGYDGKVRAVRVNDWTTHWTYRDVVEVVENAGQNLDCIMLPKVQTAEQVVALDMLLTQIEKTMGFEVGRIGIEAQIENALGLTNVNAIAAASQRVETIIFGPADFMASINMKSLVVGEQPQGYDVGDAYHHILMSILMAARAYDKLAIDGPYLQIKDVEGYKRVAGRDYQQRMAAIFSEMRRVLKPDGIMTLMFTHKATGAWDALTKGLMEAGFAITASWPINTEAEGSLHIKDKSAANSTVFLVCRPLAQPGADTRYWEDVEPKVRAAVRERIGVFQTAGIRGVDLYLSCFGPALEVFSQAWPLVRGTPRQDIEQSRRKRRQAEMFDEAYDPFAVTPEDALVAARTEVKQWRLSQLAHVRRNVELDNLTSWFVLAWDAFEAPVFPFDEANKLAKVCGVDLDRDVVGRLAEKKGADLVLWDSVTRAAKGSLGLPDGRDSMMDALHQLARTARTASLESANELLAKHGLAVEPAFLTALEAVLEVLPVGTIWSGFDLPDAAKGAGADFDALENLRRLALAEKVAEPEQLKIWQQEELTV